MEDPAGVLRIIERTVTQGWGTTFRLVLLALVSVLVLIAAGTTVFGRLPFGS